MRIGFCSNQCFPNFKFELTENTVTKLVCLTVTSTRTEEIPTIEYQILILKILLI
ncbi:hypothetical protein PAHAL_9G589100 [Panicum hallii]|uniref:Uncharacterized protein n=1 Tax=Panicum hallii TaxID=206008 RepID=A0A2T8I676_9POAL|nr:hypothetical protein PAHAL_9G589100 [Panicum hallii]